MRADIYLVDKKLAESRQRAKNIIEDGRLTVNGKKVQKAAFVISDSDIVEIAQPQHYEYVSRGGYKLEAALNEFGISVENMTAIDLGASSGGFCDCLLQRGIKKIYAVDCGSGQLAAKIRNDSRVISFENTNARFIDSSLFGEKADIAVMDLSFISQTLIYPAVTRILKNGGVLVSLIKPQFECGRSAIGKNGIVKSEKDRKAAIQKVIENAKLFGLTSRSVITSPITGGDGNVEYLTVFDFNSDNIQNSVQEE